MSVKRIRAAWSSMKQRCQNPKSRSYHNYGARGIKVCEEWRDDFKAFYDWSMNNGYASNLTIDRIDSNGNYEPSNCRWATMKEQQNNKRNTIRIEIDGKIYTLNDLSKIYGVERRTLYERYIKGASLEELIRPTMSESEAIRKANKALREKSMKISIGNETHSVSEWSKITGIKRSTLYNRYAAGKTGLDIIRKPRKKAKPRKENP